MMAEDHLAGGVAVVTGAAKGIGAAVARRLVDRGMQVVLADVDEATGGPLAAELGATFVTTDVTDLAANQALVERALELHGRIDLVHLNAGVATGTNFGVGFDLACYRRAMAINLDGPAFGIQAVLDILLAQGTGQIVVTASMAGLTPVPFDPIYGANKSAVVSMVRSLGAAHRGSGVRINALCPSFADTDIIADIREFLVETSFPILEVGDVVEAFEAIVDGPGTGECWYVVPGRPSEPFAFRNVPGPGKA